MIATLVGQALRIRLRSIAIWSLSLCALTLVMLAVYPSMSKIDMGKLLEQYPEGMLEAFGIESIDQYNTPMGFLNAELFSMLIPLAIVFLPLGIVNQRLPAAEERTYLDHLLCTPVARRQVVASAAITGAIALACVIGSLFVATLVASEALDIDLGAADLARSCLALWPLASFFASAGVLVAGATAGRGRTLGAGGGLMVAMYLLPVVAAFSEPFEQIQKFSVFRYYNEWLQSGIDWSQYLLVLAACAVLTAIGGVLFERRDIAS